MNAYTEGQWMAQQPDQFIDKRNSWPRNSTVMVVQHHRAWRGVAVRKGENGKPEYARCCHGHNKKSAARMCGEKLARALNREATS